MIARPGPVGRTARRAHEGRNYSSEDLRVVVLAFDEFEAAGRVAAQGRSIDAGCADQRGLSTDRLKPAKTLHDDRAGEASTGERRSRAHRFEVTDAVHRVVPGDAIAEEAASFVFHNNVEGFLVHRFSPQAAVATRAEPGRPPDRPGIAVQFGARLNVGVGRVAEAHAARERRDGQRSIELTAITDAVAFNPLVAAVLKKGDAPTVRFQYLN